MVSGAYDKFGEGVAYSTHDYLVRTCVLRAHFKCLRSRTRRNTGLRNYHVSTQAKTRLRSRTRRNTGVLERTFPTLKGVPPPCVLGTGGYCNPTFGE
jgi:hypothetical protein